MKFLITIIFLLVFKSSFSQDLKIDAVTLSYMRSSIYQGPMKEVDITLAENDRHDSIISVYVRIDGKLKSNFEISNDILKELSNQILIIEPKDIIFDDTGLYAMDSSTTSLNFGYFRRSVTYTAYALDKNDENTTRKGLLKIVQRILEIGEVKIKGIN